MCFMKVILIVTLALKILQPMLLDLGGARVGVLSRLFEDREGGRQGKVPCTQSSKNMKMHL